MQFYWLLWGFVCVVGLSEQKSDIDKLYEKKGNVTIFGIFDNRFGDKCNEEVEKSLEETASAIWTVKALNNYNYLPGITIGLTLYGVCESNHENLSMLVDKLFNEDTNYMGILTTPEIQTKLLNLKRNIVQIEHIISSDVLVDATIQLLLNLHWMNVNALISDSANILKSFREKASEEDVFTHEEFLISNSSLKLNKSEISPVVVVIATFATISNLRDKLQNENIKLILTPADFVFDVTSLDLPKNTIISLPSMENKSSLLRFIKNDFFTQKPPTKGPLFIGTAASILKFLKPIKNHCQNANFYYQQPCVLSGDFLNGFHGYKNDLLSQKSMKITPRDVEETLKVLKIEPSSNDEMFLYITSVINANTSEDLALFQIFNLNTKSFEPVLTIFKDNMLIEAANKSEYLDTQARYDSREPVINLLRKFGRDKNSLFENITALKSCNSQDVQSHLCSTFIINHTAATTTNNTIENNSTVAWRFLTWVSINTSLGFVGVTCTLSTMLFIIIRLCKDDILEGSPYFTLLLMILVILTYVSSLPFHVEFFSDNGFICLYRKNGPPMVFACLFSLLLSRSFVIAFSENAGEFENYLNGYLQSILCFFMIGVQISLISQNWLLEKDNYNLNCENEYDKYKIFFTLGYDFFLLILLACVSPFIMRSKQSYKEGLLFAISVFFITIVWSGWISFYILLPNEYKDAAVAIGLNSTASVLLFCIFIPQIYFMAAPYNGERTLRSLSSLHKNILTDLSNGNFKSNQALNENGFGTILFKNSEVGLSNPNFLTSRSGVGGNNPVRDILTGGNNETRSRKMMSQIHNIPNAPNSIDWKLKHLERVDCFKEVKLFAERHKNFILQKKNMGIRYQFKGFQSELTKLCCG